VEVRILRSKPPKDGVLPFGGEVDPERVAGLRLQVEALDDVPVHQGRAPIGDLGSGVLRQDRGHVPGVRALPVDPHERIAAPGVGKDDANDDSNGLWRKSGWSAKSKDILPEPIHGIPKSSYSTSTVL